LFLVVVILLREHYYNALKTWISIYDKCYDDQMIIKISKIRHNFESDVDDAYDKPKNS